MQTRGKDECLLILKSPPYDMIGQVQQMEGPGEGKFLRRPDGYSYEGYG